MPCWDLHLPFSAAMLIALTRAVPPSIARCELTHLVRQPIDVEVATRQHRDYEQALTALGCTVRRLPLEPELPDSVFVEDTAVVLPEIAVLTRPGAESRRAEVGSVAEVLHSYRPLAFVEAAATLDGGDVLCIGSRIVVGQSERTSADGIRQLRDLLMPFGYEVQSVSFSGCLHLKTAVTAVDEHTVLLNPEWIDPEVFAGFEQIEVHPDEPFAANALRLEAALLFPAAYPKTRQRLERRGLPVHVVEVGELAKAEAGLTCCSLLVRV
jgi:dimethylargininase